MVVLDEKNTVAERIESMRESENLNKKQFAEFLGLNEKTLGNWSRAGATPGWEFLVASHERGFSLDYVVMGEGEMYRANRPDQVRVTYSGNGVAVHQNNGSLQVNEQSADTGGRSSRLCQFARWWMETRSADDQAWLESQIKRAVPEYAEWVKGQGK